jgi:hypothetical protein
VPMPTACRLALAWLTCPLDNFACIGFQPAGAQSPPLSEKLVAELYPGTAFIIVPDTVGVAADFSLEFGVIPLDAELYP